MFRKASVGGMAGTALLAVALAAPGGLAAQDGTTAANGIKVGVFNADRVLAESQPGQQALALLEQLQQQRLGELQAQQDEINTLRQQALTATGAEAGQLQRQLEDRGIQFQRLQQDVQNELAQRQQELTGGIVQQISGIIDQLGAAEGFTLIFNSIQSGLVYVDESVDITDRIIEQLNAASAAGGS